MTGNKLPDVMTEAYRQFVMEDTILWSFAPIFPALPDVLLGVMNVMNTVAKIEGLPQQARLILDIATNKPNKSMPSEDQMRLYWGESQPIIFQMILSRGVDNFVAYLAGVLASIFCAHPNLLQPKQKAMNNQSLTDEQLADLAEDTVNRLTRKSMSKLAEYFANNLNFVLFPNSDDYDKLYYINEVRNIIVHNQAKADKKFISHVSETTLHEGELIQLELNDVLDCLKILKSVAADIDVRAISQFNLPVLRAKS